MLTLNLINKLLKKSRHYAKKTKLPFFQAAADRLTKKKQDIIFAELDKLAVQPDFSSSAQVQSRRIIWICWFQGLEQAPPLVRRCIESVQRNASGAEVVILTDDSINTYLELPAHITEKYAAGLISKAHYSDIVRCALLYQYGGIWMDATLYLTRPVPESLFTFSFSSLRSDEVSPTLSTSCGYWTAFLLAAKKNSPLAKYVRDIFYDYWQHHDVLIEYFLIDYTLLYSVEKYPQFAELIREQPVIGNNRYLIRQFMNEAVSADTVQTLQSDKTGIYKLSHKAKYQTRKNGVETLYGKILRNDFMLRE
ncbi:capsular polysaccharide synthesis protein [Enterobacter sp.]|uniref:capsular polysaccharide synthesis protein n=1 Tax=Enterobacter sp. TaxID=42895 RepID=UPI0029816281|nr:capsular polysaccharide synthesis protein [Enterobacter sp.]